jgi:putative peptide zinc metalloprotease protein
MDEAIDFETLDLTHQRPRLASDLAFWPVWEDGRRVVRIEQRNCNRFYRVGFREYIFLSYLDGNRSVAAACGLTASRLGTDAVSATEAESILVWLLEEGLATLDASPATFSPPARHGSRESSNGFARFNPFWLRVPLLRHSKRLDSLLSTLAPLASTAVIAVASAIILVGVVSYALHHDQVHESAAQLIHPSHWWSVLVTWIVLKCWHELGHAVACRKLGCRPRELGVILILFAPLAYVDVTSCWRLPRRSSRMMVSAAGIFVELFIAAVAMIAWLFNDSATVQFWLANVIATAGVSTLLFNANPLMRFDGYYLLSDAVDISNLYGEGLAEVRRLARGVCFGESISYSGMPARRRVIVATYGIAASVWRIFVCLLLCVTASTMFAGAGVLLAVFGVAAWFGRPVAKLFAQLLDLWRNDRGRFVRAVASGAAAVWISWLLLSAPIPTSIGVPAIVSDPPRAIVRTSVEGFVRDVFVTDGQQVKAGQPLVRLENRELFNRVNALRSLLKENEISRRIAADQHDAAAERIATQDRIALQQKLSRLQPKLDGLRLHAPMPGKISARNLSELTGQFLREGDEVLRLLTEDREVIGIVPQNHVRVARASLGGDVAMRDARNRQHSIRIRVVEPRATRTIPDASLAAINGGPLAVEHERKGQEKTDSQLRLVRPHFLLKGEIESAQIAVPPSGMRTRVYLGRNRENALQWLTRAIRNVWRSHKRDANRQAASLEPIPER